MANRNGGFIGTDGLDAPDPPTAVTPTAGDAQVSVAFTAPTDTGTSAITGFVAQVSTDGTDYSAGSNTGSSSPIVVSSLTNNTAATAKVWAINAYGTSSPSDASASVSPAAVLGFVVGGNRNLYPNNRIDSFPIATTGNSTDYGNLTGDFGSYTASCASTTRVLTGGGNGKAIDYFTVATTGSASDFGDMTVSAGSRSALSNSTRGVWGGSYGPTNVIDYVTIASTGNATDFGNLTASLSSPTACSSPTRGVFAGGFTSSRSNVIQYITIASTGNATDFGDLVLARRSLAGSSSSTRGVFSGGTTGASDRKNEMDLVTIASTGNASNFGDLTRYGYGLGGTSSGHGGLS